jgi:hypothetical protein
MMFCRHDLIALKKWINNTIPKAIATKSIFLEIHYKYDRLNNMVKLLDVIDKSKMVSYL